MKYLGKYIGKLNAAEWWTLIYIAITTVMTVIFWKGLSAPAEMLSLRCLALVIMAVANLLCRLPLFSRMKYGFMLQSALRSFPLFILLIWWYPETYDFCSQFPYLDHVFAGIDQMLFGCQPALLFDQTVSNYWWSEAFYMGYYLYYYMMAFTVVFYLIWRNRQFEWAAFITIGSFFLYYFVYELLPVAGPQYYFRALTDLGIYDGHSTITEFPDLGYYFRTHTDMLDIDPKGFFSRMVITAHEIGERPTAAFPSSHVGVTTIVMMLAWKSRNKWLFWVQFPIYILLCCGTVYIKAHYLIDSICGFITAVMVFYLCDWMYRKVMKT